MPHLSQRAHNSEERNNLSSFIACSKISLGLCSAAVGSVYTRGAEVGERRKEEGRVVLGKIGKTCRRPLGELPCAQYSSGKSGQGGVALRDTQARGAGGVGEKRACGRVRVQQVEGVGEWVSEGVDRWVVCERSKRV